MGSSDKILQAVIGAVVVALVVVMLLPIVNDFVDEAVGEETGTLYSILEFLPNIIAIVAFVGILGYLTSLLRK